MATNRLVEKKEVAAYAQFLMDQVLEVGGKDAVLDVRAELREIVKTVRDNKDLLATLTDITLKSEQRKELAEKVFADANPILASTISICAERGDIDKLSRIFTKFEELIQDKLNLSVVEVTTVVELDDKLRQSIKDKVAADLGCDVVLEEYIDKSILGGIIMSAQGKRIDASILSQLDHARSVLAK